MIHVLRARSGGEDDMKRTYQNLEQVVRKLLEANRTLRDGTQLVEVCTHVQDTEQACYRWWSQFNC
jgi:hypothetical protein